MSTVINSAFIFLSSGGVAELRVAELDSDPSERLRELAQTANDVLFELRFAAGGRLGSDRPFDVAVQALVRVEIRAVGWVVEDLIGSWRPSNQPRT